MFKTSLYAVLFLLFGLFLSGCSVKPQSSGSAECQTLCTSMASKCDQVNVSSCAKDCTNWDAAKRDCLSKANNCAEMEQTCAWKVTLPTAAKDCTSACNNYVAQCISQVPNATDALREEAFQSCSSECKSWPLNKIGCIAGCKDCPSMTETCGL